MSESLAVEVNGIEREVIPDMSESLAVEENGIDREGNAGILIQCGLRHSALRISPQPSWLQRNNPVLRFVGFCLIMEA